MDAPPPWSGKSRNISMPNSKREKIQRIPISVRRCKKKFARVLCYHALLCHASCFLHMQNVFENEFLFQNFTYELNGYFRVL